MAGVAKRGLALLVIGFAAFYLLSEPENAASALQGAFDAIGAAIGQVVRFFTALAE